MWTADCSAELAAGDRRAVAERQRRAGGNLRWRWRKNQGGAAGRTTGGGGGTRAELRLEAGGGCRERWAEAAVARRQNRRGARAARWLRGGAQAAAGRCGLRTPFFYFFNAQMSVQPYGCPASKFFLPHGALSPKLTSFIWILAVNGLLDPMEVSVWAHCAPKICCTPDLKIDCTNKIGFVPSNHSFIIPQQCCSRRALIPCWS